MSILGKSIKCALACILTVICFHVGLKFFGSNLPGAQIPDRIDADSDTYSVVLDSAALHSSQKPKVILLGGSTMRDAIRPQDLEKLLPEYEVHNAAQGGGPNFSEYDRIASHLILEVDRETANRSVVLVSILFMIYATNDSRYPNGAPSFVQQEEARLPLFWARIFSDDLRRKMKVFVRPYYALSLWIEAVAVDARSRWMRAMNITISPEKPNIGLPDRGRKAEVIKNLTNYMGPPAAHQMPQEQIDLLNSMIAKLKNAGFHVAIYDMPVATWLKEELPYDKLYRQQELPRLKSLSSGKVFYAECNEELHDSDFKMDAVHAIKVREREMRWAHNLADCIRTGLVMESKK